MDRNALSRMPPVFTKLPHKGNERSPDESRGVISRGPSVPAMHSTGSQPITQNTREKSTQIHEERKGIQRPSGGKGIAISPKNALFSPYQSDKTPSPENYRLFPSYQPLKAAQNRNASRSAPPSKPKSPLTDILRNHRGQPFKATPSCSELSPLKAIESNKVIFDKMTSPGKQATKSPDRKETMFLTLKTVLDTQPVDFIKLAGAIRSIQDAYPLPFGCKLTGLGCDATKLSNDEIQCIEKSQKLLLDLQHIAKATLELQNTLALCTENNDIDVMIRAIRTANRAMDLVNVCEDHKKCRQSIKIADTMLEMLSKTPLPKCDAKESNSLSKRKELLRTLCPSDLMVIHIPNNVWSAKLTGMYHQTIGNLTKSIERELAGLDATPQPKRVTTGRISVSPKPHSSRFKRYEKEGSNSAYSQLQNGKVEKPSTVTELRFKIHFDSQIRLLAIDQSTYNELRQRPVTYPPRQQQNKDRSKETNHHETTFLNVDGHRYESPPFSVVFNRIFCFCTHQTEDDHPPVPSTSLNFRIRYQDSEGDFITLISEDDWKLLLGDYYRATHIKRNGNLSQLGPMELYCDIPPIPHSRDIRSPEDQTRRIGGPSTGTCHVPVEFPGGERLKRIGAPSFTRNLFAPTHLKSKGMNANRALEHSDRRPSSVQKAPLCVRGAPTLGVVNNGKGNLPDKLTPNSKSNITPVIDRNIRFSCPKRVWNEQSEYDIPSIRSEETKSISHSFLPGVTPSSQISSNLEPQCWQEAHGEYDLRTMDSVETTELQNWAKKAMNEAFNVQKNLQKIGSDRLKLTKPDGQDGRNRQMQRLKKK